MKIVGKLTIFFLASLLSLVCLAADEGKGDFSIVGVWMLKSETAPDGKKTSSVYTHYTRCKIYDADSTYYTVQLHAVGDEMMILAHEMGRYRLNDSIYMERDRVMPFHIINDSTVVLEFDGYKETIVRTHTMTEERKEEIRNLVRQYPNDADAPVKHFVLSTTERELKAENRFFLYTIILMCLLTIASVGYVNFCKLIYLAKTSELDSFAGINQNHYHHEKNRIPFIHAFGKHDHAGKNKSK